MGQLGLVFTVFYHFHYMPNRSLLVVAPKNGTWEQKTKSNKNGVK